MKGLLRESILMTYVRLNVILYGRKHISSGTYIITKQTDTLNASGYRTQLNLVRIKGDNLL
jgi:phage protein D